MTNEEAIDIINNRLNTYYCTEEDLQALDLAIKALNCQESLEKKIEFLMNERHGEWIDNNLDEYGFVECPFCHKATNCVDNIDELHFCWNCGARLGKGGKEE